MPDLVHFNGDNWDSNKKRETGCGILSVLGDET